MIKCIVEFYGTSREISGLNEIEIFLEKGNRLKDLISELRKKIPVLQGPVILEGEEGLEESCVINLDGRFYYNGDELRLKDGDRIRFLTLAVGG